MVADPHSLNADPQANQVLKNKRCGSGFGFYGSVDTILHAHVV
jgi:hypothetical protein